MFPQNFKAFLFLGNNLLILALEIYQGVPDKNSETASFDLKQF